MKTISIVLSVIVLAGCQAKKEHWKLDAPVHLNSNQRPAFSKLFPDSVRRKEHTKALLFDASDSKTYLVFDNFSVTLQTVDKDEVQIDSVHLIHGFNDEDRISDISINADKTIIKIDSMFANFIENPDASEQVITRTMSIDTRKFRIGAGGKIEEVDE